MPQVPQSGSVFQDVSVWGTPKAAFLLPFGVETCGMGIGGWIWWGRGLLPRQKFTHCLCSILFNVEIVGWVRVRVVSACVHVAAPIQY